MGQKLSHAIDVGAVFILGIVYALLLSVKTLWYYLREWIGSTASEIRGIADRLRARVRTVR